MTPEPLGASGKVTADQVAKKAAAKLGNRRAVQRSAVVIAPHDVEKAIGQPVGSPRWVQGKTGLLERGYPGLAIEGDDVKDFGAKLVRGISRYLWDLVVASDQVIEVSPSRNDRRAETEAILDNPGLQVVAHDWGTGSLRFKIAALPGRPQLLSLWYLVIWDHVLLSATLEAAGLEAALAQGARR